MCRDLTTDSVHNKVTMEPQQSASAGEVTFPSRIPFEDDKFKWDYDDKGVICRYNKEEEGWEVMEPYCVECGHRDDECECCNFYGREEEVSDSEDGWEEECNQCNIVLDESTGREWIAELGCLCARCYELRKGDFPTEE